MQCNSGLASPAAPGYRACMTLSSLRPRDGALAVLLALAALTPSLFWLGCVEVFDSPKSLLLLAGGILLAFLAFAGRFAPPRDPVTLAVVAGVLAAALATVASVSPLTSLLGHPESQGGLLTLASLAAAYLAARVCVHSRAHASALAAALAVAAALAAGYGLLQALKLDPVPWEGRSDFAGWFRPGGTEGHAIKLGGLLVTVLPLLVWLGGRQGTWTAAALTLLLLAVLASLLARGAWLGLAAAAVVGLLLVRRPSWLTWTRMGLALGVIALAVFLSGAWGPFVKRLAGMGESTSRLYIYQTAWRLFLDRPLAGWGPDTFHIAFGLQRIPEYWAYEWGRTPSRAHNEVLHLLATQGLLGAAAFLALTAALARAGWLALARAPEDRGLVAALLASVAAYLVQLLTGFSAPGSGVAFALVCALLARLSEGPLDEQPFPAARPLLPWLAFLAWAGVAANLLLYLAAGVKAWLALAVLGLLAGAAVRAFLPPPGEASEGEAWDGWMRPAPLCAAAAACAALWFGVARPAAAWGLAWHEPLAARHEATRWAPERPEIWLRLASAANKEAIRAGEGVRLRRLAVESAREAVRLVPCDPYGHDQLARALLEQARSGEAGLDAVLSCYDAALALDPRNVVLMRDAARAAVALREPARAEPYLTRAVAAGPPHPTILAEVAALALSRGDLARAREAVLASFDQGWADDYEGFSRAWGLYLMILLDTHNPGEAFRLSHRLVDERPDWAVAHVLQGLALERLGRKDEARAAFTRALAVEPANAHALQALRRVGA